jgi:hypothetical protein
MKLKYIELFYVEKIGTQIGNKPVLGYHPFNIFSCVSLQLYAWVSMSSIKSFGRSILGLVDCSPPFSLI